MLHLKRATSRKVALYEIVGADSEKQTLVYEKNAVLTVEHFEIVGILSHNLVNTKY
jgi:hypothetical protein